MGNPNADNLLPAETSFEDAKHSLDKRDLTTELEDFNRSYRIEAIITAVPEDPEEGADPTPADQYTLDLYERGYTKPNGDHEQPTREGMIGHVMHAGDWFEVGDKVRVRLMPDHRVWIMHEPRPQTGVVVTAGPAGEGDLTGQYYWIALSRFWNTDASRPSDLRKFETGASQRVVPAENLAEKLAETHNLEEGTPVVLHWDWDNATPPNKRYFFQAGSAAPPGQIKVGTVAEEWEPGANSIMVQPPATDSDPDPDPVPCIIEMGNATSCVMFDNAPDEPVAYAEVPVPGGDPWRFLVSYRSTPVPPAGDYWYLGIVGDKAVWQSVKAV